MQSSLLPVHFRFNPILMLLLATMLCACSAEEASAPAEAQTPLPTAATLGEQIVLTPVEWLASEPYASADRAAGADAARVCAACHSLNEGGANMVGPNLYGFFTSPVGNVSGYSYSNALREADFVWTPRALDAWLQQPAKFLPGNRMTYPGLREAADRDNLIAYLLEETGN